MFRYWYNRYFRFKTEFEKDNKSEIFAEYCMDATQDRVKRKGDRIRDKLRNLIHKKGKTKEKRDRIEKATILENDEYHNVRSKLRRLTILLILIFLAESGLNYFTSLIAIPITEETKGLAFALLRISVALVVTAIGIVCADQLFEEILPSKKYGQQKTKKQYDISRIILWLLGLIVIEYMIYHFGLARVNDIEGGLVNNDTAKSLIIMSMVVPVVAGGIGWEISNYRDAYRNRRMYDRYTNLMNKIDSKTEHLREKENGYFQKKTNDYWHTFKVLQGYKEYYNKKHEQENQDLSDHLFASTYDSYYGEALRRYNFHKERQDAIQKTKLDSDGTIVGNKIGQDND